jgi:dynein heavy chain 2
MKIDEQVAELKVTFAKSTGEAEKLKIELEAAEEKIQKASVLLEKLSGEKGRWQSSLGEISNAIKSVPSEALISSAYINYLANKDEAVRNEKLGSWNKMLKLGGFSLVNFLSDESEILEFISEGLPTDQLSTENALISLFTYQAPLIIDPNYNVSQWMINKLKKEKSVEVVSSQEKKIVNILELGIRFGKTIIVNEVDEIDSLYYNLLRRDLKKQGPRLVVPIGDKIADFNEQFRIIFLSRNHGLKLEPNFASLVCTINNMVTTKGLEEKLLSIIINDQKPEIEAKKKACLEEERVLKLEIGKLEKKLLEELASSEGNILANTSLLNSLEETKTKSIQISKSLQESSKLKNSLEKERAGYNPHAAKGAQLFLLLRELKSINHMYAFSLAEYTKVFKANLKTASKASSQSEFIQTLNHSLFKALFNQFGFGLLQKDKLALALHLLTKHDGVYGEDEYDFLLDKLDANEIKISLPSWANNESIHSLCTLNSVFPNLVKGLNLEKEDWRIWFNSSECEKHFPSKMMIKPMQKVLLVKVFRSDRLHNALETFVCESLGLHNLNEMNNSVPAVYEIEPTPEVPLLFVTSLGSDPSKEIEDFAYSKCGRDKFAQISMGGGQNEYALKQLEKSAEEGKWLCLKNLHLVPNFLPDLEKTFNNLSLKPGFKLFLTTEEHPKFPVVMLESCFKISYESPPGIKMNVERAYSTLSPTVFGKISPEESKLIFLLSFFNALLQERRTYIPQGWTKFYEFSQSDFKFGHLMLESIITDRKVDWPGLYGLFENAIYGGRIDKLVDLEILRAFIATLFNEKILKAPSIWPSITGPAGTDFKDHQKAISALPELNTPTLFGLPESFQNSVLRNAVQTTFNSLRGLGLSSANEADFDIEKQSSSILPFITLWKSKVIS